MTDLIMVIQWEFLSYNFPLMFVVCVWGGGGSQWDCCVDGALLGRYALRYILQDQVHLVSPA
jgi:hypothetical protein